MEYKIRFCVYYAVTTCIFLKLMQAQLTGPRKSRLHNYIRCTRRYTPGMCIEPVIPVWTFVFQFQNCTERYGCPVEWRSNRFVSFERCMKRCKPLVNLYTEILANDTQNLSTYLRSKSWANSGRRDIDAYYDPEPDEEIKRESVKGPAPDPLDDDQDYKYRELTPDIDDVDLEITQLDTMGHLYPRY